MKRKLLFLMTLVISAFAFNAKAQTDVTSTYLTNADFEASTPIASNLKGYGKDGTPYGFQTVDGWTSVVTNGDNSNTSYPNSGMGGAVFSYGSSYQLQGNNKSAPAAGPDGTSTKALGFFAVWGLGGYYYQDVTFPAGEYTINIPVYNQSGTNGTTTYFGFYPNSGTAQTMATPTSTGSWITLTKSFTLSAATTGQIRIGYKSNGSGSGANPHLFIDKVQIIYTAVVIKDNLEQALAYATRVNQTLSNSDLNSSISTAQTVYNSTTASQSDVDNAVETLKSATATAIADSGLTDITFVFQNGDFSSTTGWTPVVSDQFKDYNNGLIGTSLASYAASTIDATHLDTEYYLGVQCRWNTNYSSFTQSALVLPAGNYKLTYDVQNRNSQTTAATYENRYYVTAGGTTYTDESTEWMSGLTDWTTHTISFTLTAPSEVYLSLGYGTGANNFGTANTPVLYTSHLNFSVVSDADVLADAKAAWEAAHQAAVNATNDGANDNVTGAEYADITAEIAKAEPTTLADYESATQDLIDATAAFIAAAPNYDKLWAEIDKAAALGVDTTTATATANDANTTAASAVTATQDLKVAEYTYVTSTFQYGVELGEWQSSGVNTGAAKFSNEHWSATTREYLNQDDSNGQGWNANSWSLDVYQDVELPAGNYVFKAAGRIAAGDGTTVSLQVKKGNDVLGSVNDFPHNGNNARGITTDGATQFADGYTYANGGQGFGWEWRYVKFSLSETSTVRVAINAVATKSHEWFSIGDYTVNTDNEAGFALIAYNVALAEAQAALANTDYANVAGAEKAAIESAVAADATLDKTNKAAIEAATQDLIDATTAFTAAKTDYDALAAAIAEAQAIDQTVNVGDGVFQIPATAVTALNTAISDAQSVGTNATDTANTAASAAIDLQSAVNNYYASVNGPTDGVKYTIHVATPGHSRLDYPIVAAQGATSANNPTGYTFRAEEATVNTAYPEAFTFTRESYNNYYISVEMPEGTVYLTYGTDNGSAAGWSDSQIQGTTDFSKARTFEIKASATQGAFNIVNKIVNKVITCQEGGSLYTDDATILPDFAVNVANQASVDLAIAADVQYATRIFPFVPTLPAGVVAYTCAEENGTLNLVEDSAPKANEPYILYAENGVASSTLTGWGMGKAATVTSGLLVGNFANDNLDVPENSYVLQKNNDKVAFYKVDNTVVGQVYVAQYRCYLTSGGSGAKVLNFNIDEATAIDAIEALTNGTAEIYNASGVRMNKLEKGMNIIRMSNGSVKKVLVK